MEMKISSVCPHCDQDIVITGIKLKFDNPSKVEPLKSKVKGYIGWQGNKTITTPETDNTIRIDNSAPDADVNALIKQEVNKPLEDELMSQVKLRVISLLNDKVGPELNVLAEELLAETQNARNKGLCLVCNKTQNNPICNDCLTKSILDKIRQEHTQSLNVRW